MSRTLIVGASGSGKTTLLIKKLKKMKHGHSIVISSSAANQPMYTENHKLFDEFYTSVNDDLIKKIIRMKSSNKMKNKNPFLVVFDDEGSDPYFTQRKNQLTKLWGNIRHHDIHMIMCLQEVTQVYPNYRKNADAAYIFAPTNLQEKTTLGNDFMGRYEPKIRNKIFDSVFTDDDEDKYNYLRMEKDGSKWNYHFKKIGRAHV